MGKIVPLILLFIWKYGIHFIIEHLYIHFLHKLLATFHKLQNKKQIFMTTLISIVAHLPKWINIICVLRIFY